MLITVVIILYISIAVTVNQRRHNLSTACFYFVLKPKKHSMKNQLQNPSEKSELLKNAFNELNINLYDLSTLLNECVDFLNANLKKAKNDMLEIEYLKMERRVLIARIILLAINT